MPQETPGRCRRGPRALCFGTVTCVQGDSAGDGGGVEGQRDVATVQVHAAHAPEQVLVGRDGVGVVLRHGAVRGLGYLAGRRRQLPVLGRLAGREAACGRVTWDGIGPPCHCRPGPGAGTRRWCARETPGKQGLWHPTTRPLHSPTRLPLTSLIKDHSLVYF